MVINAARSKGSRLINPAPEKAYIAQMAKISARTTVATVVDLDP
jgi:hypothetical protein